MRLQELETALRDQGRAGAHGKRHARPLEDITDDNERFGVLKARVERLEDLWRIDRRKRETRGKIIIGGALLAELVDAVAANDSGLLTTLLDVLDRRVEAARDRLIVRELLGDAPLPLRGGADLTRTRSHDDDARYSEPDFDALVQSAMAVEMPFQPSDIDADYEDLDGVWVPTS